MKTIYDFSVKDSKLNEVSLTKFKDKVLLIVNVVMAVANVIAVIRAFHA